MVKKLEKTHKIVKFYIYYIVYLGVLCIDTLCLLCYNIFIVYFELSVKVKTANSGSLYGKENGVKTLEIEQKYRSFHCGENARCYDLFGAVREDSSLVFRVFAPMADKAFVIGSFNGWDEDLPMERMTPEGVFEARIDADKVKVGDAYKYKLYRGDDVLYRADPYAFGFDETPYVNSVVTDIGGFEWTDRCWLEQRAEGVDQGLRSQPINIYQLHAGSWKSREDGGHFRYGELALELAPYLKQMGYTHVELLSVMECGVDDPLRYRVGGYFAPASCMGGATGLMDFVNVMHRAGIGVILEWSPGYFPEGACDLFEFDGEALYERSEGDAPLGMSRFDVAKAEVRSFLISNAVYWIEKYHVDGLFASGVPSLIRCDGGGGCAEAVSLFKEINRTVKELYPDVLTVAEQSGDALEASDGLGFDLEWNISGMRDLLGYAETDFKERSAEHTRLSSVARGGEGYILPIPFGEVTMGKRSFLERMPGDYWKKFAGARAFEALKIFCPGKKLTFMGCEIGQFSEWTREGGAEWFLLDFEAHARHQLYCSELNNFYLAHPELWQDVGFKWIDECDCDRSVISFRRFDENGCELIVAINFAACAYSDYFLPVFDAGTYEEVFNSDELRYGGSGVTNGARLSSAPNPYLPQGVPAERIYPMGVRLRLPPLGATVLRLIKKRFED